MDEVVLVPAQQPGNGERVFEISLADVVIRRDHRDAPLPHRFRSRQPSQHAAIARFEVRADDLRRRTIDQVPVVDRLRVAEIQLMDRLTRGRVGTRVLPDHDEKRQQPFFVPWRLQQLDDILQRHVAVFARDRAKLRNGGAEKAIARAIFAGTGLEKRCVARSPIGARDLPEIAPHRRQRRHLTPLAHPSPQF